MKTILRLSKITLLILLMSTVSQAQYSYQTAKRYDLNGIALFPDSNISLQQGIGTGNAFIQTQPVWFLMGYCGGGNASLHCTANPLSFGGPADSVSLVIYGPFNDTINLGSKLINSNIDTIRNISGTSILTWDVPLSFNRGDIYLGLFMSNPDIFGITATNTFIPFTEFDTSYCTFCEGKISDLNQKICVIGYDSVSQKNKLIWEKDIYTPAQNYVVYRENISGAYDTVGFQNIAAFSEFMDSGSNPIVKSYTYRLGIQDSCGNFTNKINLGNGLAPTMTTVHLVANPAGNNTTNLIWNNAGISPYYIFRTDPSGITIIIDSVIGAMATITYTDINAPTGLNSYYLGFHKNPPCAPSLLPTYDFVRSNPSSVIVTGINELTDLSSAISIQPNPFNDFTKVDLHLLAKQDSKVVLRNVTGQTILQFDDVKTNELIINKNDLAQGLYFLEVTGDNFYARKKIIIN